MPQQYPHIDDPWTHATIASGSDPTPSGTVLNWNAGGGSYQVGNGYGQARFRRTAGRFDFELGLYFGSTSLFGSGQWEFTFSLGVAPTFPAVDPSGPMEGALQAGGFAVSGDEPGVFFPALAVHGATPGSPGSGAFYPGVAMWSIATPAPLPTSLNTMTAAFAGNTGYVSNTVPFTWAAGDLLLVSGAIAAIGT